MENKFRFTLAQGAPQSSTHSNDAQSCPKARLWRGTRGFTLAEVLITLAIIGVVAALTIPSVIANYQKTQYVTALKKNYSIFINGFRYMLANEGSDVMSDSGLIKAIKGNYLDEGEQQEFLKEFSKTFSVIKNYAAYKTPEDEIITYKYMNQPDEDNFTHMPIFYLNDGTIVYFYIDKQAQQPSNEIQDKIKAAGGKMTTYVGEFAIDVNGARKPNKIGRDFFVFYIDNFGMIFPFGGKDAALYISEGNPDYSENHWSATEDMDNSCTTKEVSRGLSCAARIMEEDWKMNY